MYYLLNFKDHTFTTEHYGLDITEKLNAALNRGEDLSDYEIVNAWSDDSRISGEDFLNGECFD